MNNVSNAPQETVSLPHRLTHLNDPVKHYISNDTDTVLVWFGIKFLSEGLAGLTTTGGAGLPRRS